MRAGPAEARPRPAGSSLRARRPTTWLMPHAPSPFVAPGWRAANVDAGSSLCDSRSNCEPTHSAWESLSGWPDSGHSVDTHLVSQVLRPSGIGRLGGFFVTFGPR